MATHLTLNDLKAFVRQHFEDFVNNKKAEVIRHNMTPDFYDHDEPGGASVGVENEEKMMLRIYYLMSDLQVTVEDMVCLTVIHGDFKAGSDMVGKVSWGWPRVLSSLKSTLETGKGINVWAGDTRKSGKPANKGAAA